MKQVLKSFAGLVVAVIVFFLLMFSHQEVTASDTQPGVTYHISLQADNVIGKPTISAALINRVLVLAHSPAMYTGEAMYQLGVKYGIDPAYALAFFHHESSYGTTGVARFTRSLGNIRCSAGYRCLYGYRAYSSYQGGYEDWYQLIRYLYVNKWHLTSVSAIVPVYAPSSDNNDVQAFISSVLTDVARWRASSVR